ncbi:MAG: cytochrome c3 family protein [Nitrospirae bacterium]|nr:cytochrome c3 family protein [Nitrospirota bacterium]
MKKILLLMVAMLLLASGSAFAVISGSAHDLTVSAALGDPISSCQYCHTPHHALTDAPLWNRNNPDPAGFTVYGAAIAGALGVTISGTDVNAPGGHSLTCLSCHDGVTEYGDLVMGGEANVLLVMDAASTNMLGTDLNGTHPIGVAWNVGNDAGLAAAVPAPYRTYATGGEERVECGSCHDPHADDRTVGGANSPFLRGDKSTMCSDCHDAK